MDKVIIAHRGNICGPNPQRENTPAYIREALSAGFDVEVDVWLSNNKFYLGHDRPEFIIDEKFLENDKIWTHCKNLYALDHLICNPLVHCFAHSDDDFVLTTRNYIWCYPKIQTLTNNSIAVLPELIPTWNFKNCAGICTDYVIKYEEKLKEINE